MRSVLSPGNIIKQFKMIILNWAMRILLGFSTSRVDTYKTFPQAYNSMNVRTKSLFARYQAIREWEGVKKEELRGFQLIKQTKQWTAVNNITNITFW